VIAIAVKNLITVQERATAFGTPLICSLLSKHTDVEIAKI
jgi:hypothetical protein